MDGEAIGHATTLIALALPLQVLGLEIRFCLAES
jgi:hypothetical protein